ncbi:hypothetical protein [Rubritalea tangerina]
MESLVVREFCWETVVVICGGGLAYATFCWVLGGAAGDNPIGSDVGLKCD